MGFDLYALLDSELKSKKITAEEEIQYYFYRRCGQLFSFDPVAVFGTDEYREKLRNVRLDMRNIETLEINCHEWAYLFVDLLKEKGINAEVVEIDDLKGKRGHAFVVTTLKTGKYAFDLMARFKDIMRVKYGFATQFPKRIDEKPMNNNSLMEYITFEKFKDQLIEKFNKDIKENGEVKKYKVLKCIENIVNNPILESKNIDYFSGIQFIDELINGIIKSQKPKYTFYANIDENFYAKVYSFVDEEKTYFFAYQREGNCYKLCEVSQEKVEEMENKSSNINGLTLIKKNPKFEILSK